MFLSEIGQFNLLPVPIEENLLKLFPLAVKRTLVKAVVDDLNKREQSRGSSPVVIITPTHANWVMECVGQGFGLPYSDAPIISSVLTLYKTWLFQNRPPGMLEEEQYFLRKIAQHFSLLFEHRKDDNGQLIKETESIEDVRCRLCLQALQEIYLNTVRKFGASFTPETWDCYLKIVLTITDVILTWDSRKVLDHLATYALRTLIEIWILSKTRDVLLWGALRALCLNHDWISRTISTIHQLNQINFSLTNQAIRAMYLQPYGTADLQISFAIDARLDKTDDVILEFSTEDCYYYWYKFLTLAGNPSTIRAPDTFHLAFWGMNQIIDTYISIGDEEMGDLWKEKDSQRPTPPNATVLLNIYGNPLFEACVLDSPGFEKGTAVAIKTLCKIFIDTVNIEPILPRYSASFYACLGKMLLKPQHNIVSHALLQQGQKIFLKNLRGSHILIPHFLHGIGAAWANGRCPSVEVGVACANLLISLACFPNVYKTTALNPILVSEEIPRKGELMPVQYYSDILPHMQNILFSAFRVELEVPTLQALLWCYSIVVVELCDSYIARGARVASIDQEWILALFLVILEKMGTWHNRALMTAFEVLSFLAAHVCKHLASKTLAHKLIATLTNRIIKHCVSPSNDEETLHFIAGCYKCIGDWIVADSRHTLWQTEHELGILLVKAIQHGLESPNLIHKQAAEYLFHRILSMNDSHNGLFNSSTISELHFLEAIAIQNGATELSPLDLWNNYGQCVRFLSLNNQIVSIIDQPDLTGNTNPPTVNVIVRGPAGKQVWNCKMTLFGNHNNVPSSVVPTVPQEILPQPGSLYDNMDTSHEAITFEHEPELYFNVEDIIAREQGCLLMSDYGLDADIQYQVPIRPGAELWAGENKSQFTRLFLAHTGLLAPNTFEIVNFLSADHVFHQGLSQLDSLSAYVQRIQTATHETILSTVLFWKKGQKTAEEILDNLSGSLEFNEFLDSLGWLVTFDKHTGYTADLQYSSILIPYGLPYYCDSDTEFLFLVGTLISNGEPEAPVAVQPDPVYDEQGNEIPQDPVLLAAPNRKYAELMRSNAIIVWLEDEYDWNPMLLAMLGSEQAHTIFVIIPLMNGLYRVWVQMDRYGKPSPWLQENCLFSKHTLALFMRRYLKINHSTFQPSNYQDGYFHVPNYTKRTDQIREILSVVESNLTLQEFYAYLLSSATPIAHQGVKKQRVKHVRQPLAKPEEKAAPAALKPMAVPKPDVSLPVLPTAKTKKDKKNKNKDKNRDKGKTTARSSSGADPNVPETPKSAKKGMMGRLGRKGDKP